MLVFIDHHFPQTILDGTFQLCDVSFVNLSYSSHIPFLLIGLCGKIDTKVDLLYKLVK